jgi:type II secretory pathway pseudopilin PulG
MTLIEISISVAILVTILMGFCQALMGSTKAARTTREASIAADAARQMMETLRAEEFSTVFAANNSVAADDPPGVTARLAAFDVPGLRPRDGDTDGICGQIIWPELVAAGASTLREDTAEPLLSMPRDLDGDGIVDNTDHSGDYGILLVVVRVEWRGGSTNGRVEFKTILSDF